MVLAWGLFALLWTLGKRPLREGVLTLTFGLYYGICRLIEDSLRIDKRFGPFTGSQWTALTVATISLTILLVWAVRARREPPDLAPAVTRKPDEEPLVAAVGDDGQDPADASAG
jgi:prolipoprotein diacylglyceryltransferase